LAAVKPKPKSDLAHYGPYGGNGGSPMPYFMCPGNTFLVSIDVQVNAKSYGIMKVNYLAFQLSDGKSIRKYGLLRKSNQLTP
jgi:hypothetical protein